MRDVLPFLFAMLLALAEVAPANAQDTGSGLPEIPALAGLDKQEAGSASYPDDPKLAAHFSGRVTDLEGKPVRGAKVFIVPNKGLSTVALSEGGSAVINPIPTIGPMRAETDAEGRFEFDAPDMAYTAVDGFPVRRQGLLVATAEGFAPDWMTTWGDNSAYGSHWDPVRGAPLELQLGAEGVPIRGRFLDPEGRPLAGALVQLTRLLVPEDRDLDGHFAQEARGYGLFSGADYERDLSQPDLIPGLVTEARTDAEGRFTLSGLGRDWLAVLQASEPRVVRTVLTVMTRDAPDLEIKREPDGEPVNVVYGAGFTLKLEPGRTVKGRVVDRDTGEPIPGMWVGPRQNHYAGVSGTVYPWRTDEDGRFIITGLPPKLALGEIVMAISAPGVPYQTVGKWIGGNAEMLIKCPRGIPFQLKVVDDQGRPVEAEVTYADVQPNPHVENLVPWGSDVEQRYWPNAPAARIADGVYKGFVLPGPGAVLVKTPRSAGYRPACVDPKAFFAPGRTEWTESQEWAYGTRDRLATAGGGLDQEDYAAIVLVNRAPGSSALELTATVVRDTPREVRLIDSNDQPVEIEIYRGRTPRLAASFLLTGLHPDRARPLTYLHEDRRLVGLLLARGDGDSPYTVRMQPWATVTGRVRDENGDALSGAVIAVTSDHPVDAARHLGGTADDTGRFQIDKLMPGHRYSGKVHYGRHNVRGSLLLPFAGMAFEKIVLRPGEMRDVGDIHTKPPMYEEFPLVYEKSGAQAAD